MRGFVSVVTARIKRLVPDQNLIVRASFISRGVVMVEIFPPRPHCAIEATGEPLHCWGVRNGAVPVPVVLAGIETVCEMAALLFSRLNNWNFG